MTRPGNTWEYYRELQRREAMCRPDQDVCDRVRFSLTAYPQQAQTVRSRLDGSSRVWLVLATCGTWSRSGF